MDDREVVLLEVGEESESRVRYVEAVVEEMVDNREGVRLGIAILGSPALRVIVNLVCVV